LALLMQKNIRRGMTPEETRTVQELEQGLVAAEMRKFLSSPNVEALDTGRFVERLSTVDS